MAVPVIIAVANAVLEKIESPLVFLTWIASSVAGILAEIALIAVVVRDGMPEGGIGGAYQTSIRLLIPFLIVSFLASLAAVGGFFILVVPAFIISVFLFFSYYVLVAEGKRGLDALIGSWHYVQGYGSAVLWRLIFLGILSFLASIVVAFLTGGLKPVITQSISSPKDISLWGQLVSIVLTNLVFYPIGVVYGAHLYKALRNVKTKEVLPDESRRIKKLLMGAMAVGIIGIIILIAFTGFALVNLLKGLDVWPLPEREKGNSVPGLTASLGSAPILELFRLGQ